MKKLLVVCALVLAGFAFEVPQAEANGGRAAVVVQSRGRRVQRVRVQNVRGGVQRIVVR